MCLFPVMFTACESLRISKPIIPLREYEKMIAGRLDANYVGTQNCLSACHYHDKIKTGLRCEHHGGAALKEVRYAPGQLRIMHGPGSLAIEGLTPEKVEADAKAGIRTECNYKTFIDINNIPARRSRSSA